MLHSRRESDRLILGIMSRGTFQVSLAYNSQLLRDRHCSALQHQEPLRLLHRHSAKRPHFGIGCTQQDIEYFLCLGRQMAGSVAVWRVLRQGQKGGAQELLQRFWYVQV